MTTCSPLTFTRCEMRKVFINYKVSVIGGSTALNHFDGQCDEQALSRMLLAANQDAIDWCVKHGKVGLDCQIHVRLSIIAIERDIAEYPKGGHGGPG